MVGLRSSSRPPPLSRRPLPAISPPQPPPSLPAADWRGGIRRLEADHPAEYAVKDPAHGLEAAELKLAEGQKLTLTIRAADLCDLGAGPNVGSGETWQLDVVTEAQLLTRLEARELLLRQRFEDIVQEMTETRNLLLKMDFSPAGKAQLPAPKRKEAGAEPGEAADPHPGIFSSAI